MQSCDRDQTIACCDGQAKRENAAELAVTASCWWRADIPPEVCEAYWRDVHESMFAVAPGPWQCCAFQSVSFDALEAAQPQGMRHALFWSEADLIAFSSNPLPKEGIPHDAHNSIGRIGALLSAPNGRTLIDGPPCGVLPQCQLSCSALFQEREQISAEAFHRYLIRDVARAWGRHPGLLPLRINHCLPSVSSNDCASTQRDHSLLPPA